VQLIGAAARVRLLATGGRRRLRAEDRRSVLCGDDAAQMVQVRMGRLSQQLLACWIAAAWPAHATSSVDWMKGRSILSVRNLLFSQGWQPRMTSLRTGDEFEHAWSTAGVMFRAGIREVEVCAGTGSNPCIFNYRNKRGQCLRVFTLGEFEKGRHAPTVDHWSESCPPAEAFP